MIEVKLRKSELDRLCKGYFPIYKQLDESGVILHYVVKKHDYNFRFNTLREAKLFSMKI